MRTRRRPTLLPLAAALFALLAAVAPAAAQTTITVTTVADSGPGSLREAIDQANSDGVATTIDFAPALAGAVIAPASQLLALSEGGDTIDGDLGGDCVPDIGLDGGGTIGDGISLHSDGNTVRGLAIHRFVFSGVRVNGDDNVVECNYLGTDLLLAPGLGNTDGVGMDGVNGNRIGPGNVIVHNSNFGVRIDDRDGGGYPGFTALTADYTGIFPVIDFPDGCGVLASADAITPLDGSGQPFREYFGMRLSGTLTIGTTGTYTFTLPRVDDGARLLLDGGQILEVTGGSPGPASTNVPVTAGTHALELDFFEGGGAQAVGLVINGPGSADLTTDGSPCAGGQPGLCGELFQLRVPGEGNTVTENSIHDNGVLGIALNCCCGPIANDPGDGDVGPNTLLNTPVLAGLASAGGGSYTVSGTAPPDSTVEVFISDGDSSGFGEGKTFLGTAAADPGGSFAANVLLPGGPTALTATATDTAGNTSEFAANFAVAGQDTMSVGTVNGVLPGTVVEVPIYVRDLLASPLGVDRPAGSRIQGLVVRVTYAPAASVQAVSVLRAGITAGLAPLFENTTPGAGSVSYVGSFSAATDPIPFTPDAAAPGDQVLKIAVTLAPNAAPGQLTLALDAGPTRLSNQAGTLDESAGNGTLALAGGAIDVLANSAANLFALAQSASAIQLTWSDPQQSETAMRVERSTDGASWTTAATLGPDDTAHLDSGLAAATLYSYRVIAVGPAGDALPSNVATASTFPATAAKVCIQKVSVNRTSARFASPAYRGPEWGVAWMAREDGVQDDIYFQRRHGTTLDPIGAPVQVTDTDAVSIYPTLAWNGSHYGLVWFEHQRAEPGTNASATMFALLNPDGSKARGDLRLFGGPTAITHLSSSLQSALAWDGTHWGLFTGEVSIFPLSDIAYRRLDADGDVVLGPVAVTATPGDLELEVAAAWSPSLSQFGVAWIRGANASWEVWFQRVEETTGAALGGPALLGSFASPSGTFGLSVVWDGAEWAVAWTQIAPDESEFAVYLRKVDASGAALGAAPERLSDDANPADPALDGLPVVMNRPGGGFAVFTASTPALGSGSEEVARLAALADGSRDGARAFVTADDGRHSSWPRVASDGGRYLVVWNDSGPGTLEIAGALVDATGATLPASPVALTAGHSPGNTPFFNPNPLPAVAPVGAGFAVVWADQPAGANLPFAARIFDGAGSAVADIPVLTASPRGGRPVVVGVGNGFAAVWKDTANNVIFARYDVAGAPITGEIAVANAGSGQPQMAMAWSGEVYGVLFRSGPSYSFVRVAPDGTPLGAPAVVFANAANPFPQLVWTGFGWAALWMAPDGNLRFGFLDPQGTVGTPETPLTAVFAPQLRVNQYHMAWNGGQLGVAWSEWKGPADPPGQDIWFTVVNLDGSKAFPEVAAVSTPAGDLQPQLYWAGGVFHLVHQDGASGAVREIEVQADGTVLAGERFWSNRGFGGISSAWNGATLALAGTPGNLRDLHFETSACVEDLSAPPCPVLTAVSQDGRVQLAWSSVSDPESGIWRYNLYRDGGLLAEQFPTSLGYADGGTAFGATHQYQLRALNGAFQESEGCPLVPFSTLSGDGNGDGTVDAADIFYLINYLLAGGPPPGGDGDANGDGEVDGSDLIYLINFLFGGGPAPLGPAAAPAASAADVLSLGSAAAAPGETVTIPVRVRDLAGTPLGAGAGERIQALALSVAYSPAAAVASISFTRAGVTAALEPIFETTVPSGNTLSWLASFDAGDDPIPFTADAAAPGDLIGELTVEVAPTAAAGSVITLTLGSGNSMLANQGGTVSEKAGNGLLALGHGTIDVDHPGSFFTLPPCRLLDTREAAQGPALASGAARIVPLHGVCGIPASAAVLSLNVTVTQATGFGHLTLFPGDVPAPAVSTVNFAPGQTRANNALAPLAADGSGELALQPFVTGAGTVHVILDVNGYFE